MATLGSGHLLDPVPSCWPWGQKAEGSKVVLRRVERGSAPQTDGPPDRTARWEPVLTSGPANPALWGSHRTSRKGSLAEGSAQNSVPQPLCASVSPTEKGRTISALKEFLRVPAETQSVMNPQRRLPHLHQVGRGWGHGAHSSGQCCSPGPGGQDMGSPTP